MVRQDKTPESPQPSLHNIEAKEFFREISIFIRCREKE